MKELFKKANVVAVGRGHKIINGIDTGREAIVVCVSRKIPISALKKSQLIPTIYKGQETDVIETGEIRALRTKKHRPAPGGVSIGHFAVTAGTLGKTVKRLGKRYILSNNHVLANSNNALLGDAIYQPGTYDGGTPIDTIAKLTAFVPIKFTGESDCPIAGFIVKVANSIARLLGRNTRLKPITEGINTVDCAIAEPINDSDVLDEILEIGIPNGIAEVDIGTPVKKSGRTTGLTEGTVTIMDATVNVNYGTGIAIFEDQIVTSAISEGGDSGSIVLTEDNCVTGLLFAGSDNFTVINKIQNVVNELGLDNV